MHVTLFCKPCTRQICLLRHLTSPNIQAQTLTSHVQCRQPIISHTRTHVSLANPPNYCDLAGRSGARKPAAAAQSYNNCAPPAGLYEAGSGHHGRSMPDFSLPPVPKLHKVRDTQVHGPQPFPMAAKTAHPAAVTQNASSFGGFASSHHSGGVSSPGASFRPHFDGGGSGRPNGGRALPGSAGSAFRPVSGKPNEFLCVELEPGDVWKVRNT